MVDTERRKRNAFKNIAIIIILVLTINSVSGQTSDTIFWRNDYILKYKDFLAKPDSSKIDLANSYIWISYDYKIINGKVSYSTKAYFLKQPSWAKLDWESLLDHEQTHFDINALYALKLLDTLQKSNLPITNIETSIRSIYNYITQQSVAMNNYYDKLEKQNASTGIPQKKFHKDIRNQILNLQKQIEKRTHNKSIAASGAGR